MRFKWSSNLYEFLSFCFGLGPAPKVLTKLLKIPIPLLRRINIRIIVYLDNMLLMGVGLRGNYGIEGYIDFSVAKFRVCHKSEKSILHPVIQLEFLGLQINTEEITVFLSEEKLTQIIQQCQEVYSQPRTSLLILTKLIDLLLSTVPAILPRKIQFRFLQQEQITSLKKQESCQGYVIPGNLA